MDLMGLIPHVPEKPDILQEPFLEHICKEPAKEDPVKLKIPGESIWSKIRRWYFKFRMVSEKHSLVEWSLKSSREIKYEISRHLDLYSYMIHPFSIFRMYWEFFMLPFIIIVLLVTPIFVAFYLDNVGQWYLKYNLTIDIILIADIIINFFSGYFDPKTQLIIMDPSYVRRKYLREYFIVDVLPCLPIEFLSVLFESLWYIPSLNLLKIIRIRNILIYLHRISYAYDLNFHVYKITEMTIFLVICIHWCACLEYYLPQIVAKIIGKNEESWLYSPYMEERTTILQIYLSCLNRALISLIGSKHYLYVRTAEDIIYHIILLIIGFLGFIYLLLQVLQLTTAFHATSKRHLKLIQELQQYIKHKEISAFLQRELLTYYHYCNKKRFEIEKMIVTHISPYLQQQFFLHKYDVLLKNVELFKHVPNMILIQLVNNIRSQNYMQNDIVITSNTSGDGLYFVATGTLAIYNNAGKEMCHLEDKAYFGELHLVLQNDLRPVKIVAVENSEIYTLLHTDFQRVLMPYPELLTYLHDMILKQLDQMPHLEKISKDRLISISGAINISALKAKSSFDL